MDKRLVRSRTAGKYLGPPLIVLLLFVSLPRPAGGQVAGYGGGASSPQKPEAGANTSALQALQSDFEQRRARQMLSPVYLELAEGSNPLAQALRANPDIALQYVDENGRPVYFTIHNINAAATIGTNRVHPGGSLRTARTGRSPALPSWGSGTPAPR